MNTIYAPPMSWKTMAGNFPYVTVSGFAFDSNGNFPIMHRSNNVRSAKNCWSLPSGCHEIGITMEEQFCTELREELGLVPIQSSAVHLGTYENIAVVDGFHWVIQVMSVIVEDLDCILNKEPDKHDIIEKIRFEDIGKYSGQWAPGLEQYLTRYASKLAAR